MAFNRIQFRHGMPISEFTSSAGTEEPCAEAMRRRTPAVVARPAVGDAEADH